MNPIAAITSVIVACVAASLGLVSAGARSATDTLVLTNATILDGTGSAPVAPRTVVIRDGRIQDIFRTGDREPPKDARHLDAAGKTIIPGLIESHTHLQDFYASRQRLLQELERHLYSGVVALREMAGDSRVSAELDRSARLGQIAAPHIYYSAVVMGPQFFKSDVATAGAIIRAAPANPGWIQVLTPESDVRTAIARAAGAGVTALKLYIEMEPALIRTVTAEAHRQGLKVWAHPTVFPSRPSEVVAAGVDGISHTCGLAWEDADLEPRRFAVVSRTNRPVFNPAQVQADSDEMRRLFALMVRHGTFFDATFSMYPAGGPAKFGCDVKLMTALAQAARSAGVTFLAGTDWHAPAGAAYPSLHDELVALVEHGILSPIEAITAATRNPATALGLRSQTGTVEAGKAADLVLLDRNPADDIRNIRSVFATVRGGTLYLREEYDARRATPAVPDRGWGAAR